MKLKYQIKSGQKKHWKAITLNYAKAPFFHDYKSILEDLYNDCQNDDYISQVNYKFIIKIAELLGIKTKITWSTDYVINHNLQKSQRLIALCKKTNATDYLSGPSAKQYIEEKLFTQSKININYINYSRYRIYPQLFKDFVHKVTILDLLFNTGYDSSSYIKAVESIEYL